MTNIELGLLLEQFHFLRPYWFLALIPSVLLFAILKFRQGKGSNWEKTIDASLLPHLIDDSSVKVNKNPLFLILLAWCVAIVSLAGPVWEQTPQPVHEREDALVIIFDLTRSMYATDVKPNRLIRARRKLQDLLKQRTEGVTALIVYAGDAHTVTPLTDDTKTIAEMIPVISPDIMPAPGSKLVPALELAESLFKDAGMQSGRMLIVTDEIRDAAQAQSFARKIRNAYPVSVLAVGTETGGPIPAETFPIDGAFVKDSKGVIVMAKVNFSALEDFAKVAGGRYTKMHLADDDLDYLLAEQDLLDQMAFREVERDFDIWFEEGPWLLLLLLPLAALSFRRGWIWSIVFVFILPTPQAEASLWDDLWQTRDQQGAKALESGDAQLAVDLFNDQQWKGSAQYQSGDFSGAQSRFGENKSSDGQYNLGNALAKQGEYEASIKAYEAALSLDPDNDDAKFNKQLIETLMESQEQQSQDGEGDEDSEKNDGDKDNDQQDNDQQDNDSQDKEQNQESADQQKEQEEEDQEAKDKAAEEQQDAEKQQQQEEEKEAQDKQMADAEPLNEEEEQALKQWLRRVPDDPGGLLRRKFKNQYDNKNDGKRKDDSSNW